MATCLAPHKPSSTSQTPTVGAPRHRHSAYAAEMTTNSPPGPKRKRDSEPTSLMSLGDDMLAEILSRLPSLPSLASTALARPRLCSVASSPAVLNPFLSRAPLLGYFVSVTDGAIPAFHRALLRRDRHLGAIVRRSDVHLTDFEEYKWRLVDCRHGLLLLLSNDRHLVVFDPVSCSRLPIPNKHKSFPSNSFHCFLPACSDGPTSFRVLSLDNRGGRLHAHVYSSRTGEWCSHWPVPKGISPPRSGYNTYKYLKWSMHAGGRIYWRGCKGDQLTSLDVGAMKFSHVALPNNQLLQPRSYAVGETEDGTTCLVAMEDRLLRVWFRKEDRSWELQWERGASYLLRGRVQKICDVTAGVVLLTMGTQNGALHYYAFRLKDALQHGILRPKLEAAEFFTSSGWVHPYFMAWPRPSLKAGASENAAEGAKAGSSERKKTSLKDQEAGGSKKN